MFKNKKVKIAIIASLIALSALAIIYSVNKNSCTSTPENNTEEKYDSITKSNSDTISKIKLDSISKQDTTKK